MSCICFYVMSCVASEALYLYNAGHSQYDLARHCSGKERERARARAREREREGGGAGRE